MPDIHPAQAFMLCDLFLHHVQHGHIQAGVRPHPPRQCEQLPKTAARPHRFPKGGELLPQGERGPCPCPAAPHQHLHSSVSNSRVSARSKAPVCRLALQVRKPLLEEPGKGALPIVAERADPLPVVPAYSLHINVLPRPLSAPPAAPADLPDKAALSAAVFLTLRNCSYSVCTGPPNTSSHQTGPGSSGSPREGSVRRCCSSEKSIGSGPAPAAPPGPCPRSAGNSSGRSVSSSSAIRSYRPISGRSFRAMVSRM